MQPITIQFAVGAGYVRTIRISRENNIIQIDLPYGSTTLRPAPCMFMWVMFGVLGVPIRLIVFFKLIKMDGKIGFEMSLIVVEAICGRCASFMILTATVSEIFGGQTNSSILVVGPIDNDLP